MIILIDQEDLVLLAEQGLPHVGVGRGMILGPLFLRGQTRRCEALDAPKQDAIIATQGGLLTDTCWGAYLAFLPDPDGPAWHVVRAPLGMLPCLWADADGLTWLSSDLPLMELAGLPRAKVDWAALHVHLIHPELRRSETCLSGIRDLQGGFRLTLRQGGRALTELWSPWTFARRPEIPVADAAVRLRGAVDLGVAAMASLHQHGILMLSGGIDSSIVATSLKRSNIDFECLTFRPDGAGGDESVYAKAVADHLGIGWRERRPDPGLVDPLLSASRNLPRPNERLFYQEFDRLAVATARSTGATAIFNGGGGDNIFYGYPSVAPIADCLKTANGRFRSTARALAGLTGASVPRVMWKAWRRASRKRPRPNVSNLRLDFLAGPPMMPDRLHPWNDPPEDVLPGRASHVGLLASTQHLAETADPLRAIPSIPVLLTQPAVETCLSMPTDLWFAPGWNRALARAAYRADLPQAVIDRQSKGSPDAFVVSVYESRKREIRSILLDGLLAANGLLDCTRLKTVLDDPTPARGHDFSNILELVDAETWARSRA